MASLKDDDYIKEVTLCLSQSMVQILQIRPQDPIEFLSQYLREYRRNHPRDLRNRRENDLTPDQLTSTSQLSIGNEVPEEVCRERTSTRPLCDSSVEINNTRHGFRFRDNEGGEEEEYMMGDSFSEFSHVNIVHREFRKVMLGIGDLFDEDDFG